MVRLKLQKAIGDVTMTMNYCRFYYPGYQVEMLEHSLDRRFLIVYLAYNNLDHIPEGRPAGALMIYEVRILI